MTKVYFSTISFNRGEVVGSMSYLVDSTMLHAYISRREVAQYIANALAEGLRVEITASEVTK